MMQSVNDNFIKYFIRQYFFEFFKKYFLLLFHNVGLSPHRGHEAERNLKTFEQIRHFGNSGKCTLTD